MGLQQKLALIFKLLLLTSVLQAMPSGTYGQCETGGSNATRLKIEEKEIVIFGRKGKVYEITPNVLKKKKGKCFNVVVENYTDKPTSLHWHGLIVPVLEDGVSFVTQAPIPPKHSANYNFTVVQEGTFWAHSHYGLQEQMLMAIPLILLPEEETLEKNLILFFESFTFKSIEGVWLGLRKEYLEKKEEEKPGWSPDLRPKKAMHGSPDLNDVEFDALLTNKKPLEEPFVFKVDPGEKVRLRLINGSVASGFHIDLGGVKGEVVAVDGSPIEPVPLSKFPLAAAQRADVLVTVPNLEGAYPIFAQCQGTNQQTGAILKTPEGKLEKYSSRAQTTAGAITNQVEKDYHAKTPLDKRKVDRRIKAVFQGNMEYYTWAINGNVWPNDQPLKVKEGERVEVEFVNTSGMAHPMHLHGHVFQVTEVNGEPVNGALRDTVLVMPKQSLKIQFDANNPGIWAFHCHIAYHAWGGMFTVLLYDGYTPPFFSKKAIDDYSRIYGGH